MGDDELEFLIGGEKPTVEHLERVAEYLMSQVTRYSIMLQKVTQLQALARGIRDDGGEEDTDARS